MENRCNCTMENTFTNNDNHDDSCDLWEDVAFVFGDKAWSPDEQRLIPAPLGLNAGMYPNRLNPYEHADEFIWNGDTPVISKATAERRQASPLDDDIPALPINDLEDEFAAALVAGIEQDEYGWVQYADGSWADPVNRVTYRAIKDDDGEQCWVEEVWDEEPLPTRTGEARCDCPTEKMFWCSPCGVTRDNKEDAWRWQTAQDVEEYENSFSYWTNTCGHVMSPVQLNQDLTVYASGVRTHHTDDTPDFAIYAHGGWNPACPAIFIPWQDYGLPTCTYEQAAESIKMAYQAVKDGKAVEVGCMGGHGRTGTILACMLIMANPKFTPSQAIEAARTRHCKNAVESASQDWFVEWFRAWFLGEALPERPVIGKYTYSSGTKGDPINVMKREDGSVEEIFADGTVVITPGGAAPALPKGGQSTTTPGGKGWCKHCKRDIIRYHNAYCPLDPEFGKPFKFDHNRTAEDGNKAPGATANERRKNAKRKRKQDQRRRQARQQAGAR